MTSTPADRAPVVEIRRGIRWKLLTTMVGLIAALQAVSTYVEITDGPPQNLWEQYAEVLDHHQNFAMQKIVTPADIYPVFRELFKKQSN